MLFLVITWQLSLGSQTVYCFIQDFRPGEHHDVASMNTLMQHVSHPSCSTCLYHFEGAGKANRDGMGLQITRFIPGIMGNDVYHRMSHAQKLLLIERLAIALMFSESPPSKQGRQSSIPRFF